MAATAHRARFRPLRSGGCQPSGARVPPSGRRHGFPFNANETSIHTYVTFRVVDVIKGTHNRPEIILRFLGGTVVEISLDVSESTLPEFGQKGVYFVESLDRFQVNPLYGMDQGHSVDHPILRLIKLVPSGCVELMWHLSYPQC